MCWYVWLCVWCSGKEKDGCSDTESLRNSEYNNSNWHCRQTGNTNKCHSTIFMSLTKVNYTNGPGTPTLFLTQFIYVRQAGLFPKKKNETKTTTAQEAETQPRSTATQLRQMEKCWIFTALCRCCYDLVVAVVAFVVAVIIVCFWLHLILVFCQVLLLFARQMNYNTCIHRYTLEKNKEVGVV